MKSIPTSRTLFWMCYLVGTFAPIVGTLLIALYGPRTIDDVGFTLGVWNSPLIATRMVGPEDTVVWCSGKSTPSVAVPHHGLARRRAVILLGVGMPACDLSFW